MNTNYLKLSVLTFSAFILSASLNTATAQLNFAPAVEYSTGSSPYSVVSADFNGDGNLDLATANYGSNNYSVLLNNGNGTYATAVNYTADLAPYSICTADFNEDGNMDLAISNQFGNNISIHNGLGDGTFGFDNDFGASGNPLGIVASDFDNDGNMDIVVTTNNYEIAVYFGNGSGFFPSSNNYPVDLGPVNIFAADFNGDGLKDIVTTNLGSDSLSVLLNVGAGSFTTAVNYKVNSEPFSVISADFNGDGKMDLVSANYNSSDVSVLLGNGNGTFSTAINYLTDSQPTSLTFADFNGDSKLDIATCNADAYNVSILLGSGLGSFATPINFPLNSYPSFIIADDFNLDGKKDLAIASYISDTVTILLNTSQVPASALNFDGINDHITVPYNSAFDFGMNDFTIETWAKTTSTTGNQVMIGRISTNNYWFGVSNGKARFSMTGNDVAGTSTIGDGNWHHIAAVRKNGIQYIYVDGVLEGTQNTTASGTFAGDLTIGKFGGGFNFAGSLDEVRIWNRALCKGEIVHNMNLELPNAQPGLIAYYKFNQGYDNENNSTITSLADSSGNGYDGTLNNFNLTGTTSNWSDSGAVTSGVTTNEYIPLGFTGFTQTDVTCNGANDGSYSLQVVGGTPAYTYTWSNGNTTPNITGLTAGNYTLNVTDAQTCFATWTINITEPTALVNTTNMSGTTITANATGVNYQWIDCNNANTAIAGETNQTYTATTNGNYAVVITSGACSDTSSCVAITSVGLKNNAKQLDLQVYPNPSNGKFIVEGLGKETTLEVIDVLGRVVYTIKTNDAKTNIDLSNQANGVYYLKTKSGLIQKLIKQD